MGAATYGGGDNTAAHDAKWSVLKRKYIIIPRAAWGHIVNDTYIRFVFRDRNGTEKVSDGGRVVSNEDTGVGPRIITFARHKKQIVFTTDEIVAIVKLKPSAINKRKGDKNRALIAGGISAENMAVMTGGDVSLLGNMDASVPPAVAPNKAAQIAALQAQLRELQEAM